jgi:hypothetical protein
VWTIHLGWNESACQLLPYFSKLWTQWPNNATRSGSSWLTGSILELLNAGAAAKNGDKRLDMSDANERDLVSDMLVEFGLDYSTVRCFM